MNNTVTKDMLIWHDNRCGIYKHPKAGYVLIEYGSDYARYMPARQAKAFIKMAQAKS